MLARYVAWSAAAGRRPSVLMRTLLAVTRPSTQTAAPATFLAEIEISSVDLFGMPDLEANRPEAKGACCRLNFAHLKHRSRTGGVGHDG